MEKLISKEKKWYALYTKPRWEKKVNATLIKKNIESWCPLQKQQRQWSDRKKIIEVPLFKSYVFVKINETERLSVLLTEGVINFVYYLSKPAIIKDQEIQLIKQYFLTENATIGIIPLNEFNENTKVKVNHGIFMDNEGIVLRTSSKKVYVKLQGLGQIIIIEFPKEHLSPVE